jgi:hypothetical protein
MPEDLPIVVAESLAAAFATAAAVLLLCGWPRRAPRPAFVAAGAVLGPGIGFYLGTLLLRPLPHWPPKEDQDRLLLLLFPAVLAVELLAAFVPRPRLLIWLLRGVVAASAARVLLHDSIYLKDVSDPGTAGWTPAQQAGTLALLAGALVAVWSALYLSAGRSSGRVTSLSLALSCAGAAAVIMLSGSLSAGLLALVLAATLAGVGAASLALPQGTDLRGALAPGIVGLFAALVSGHFFGSLTIANGVLLFAAPLLSCVPLPLPRTWPRLRAVLSTALVAIPLALALASASQKPAADTAAAGESGEPSVDDYANYGR